MERSRGLPLKVWLLFGGRSEVSFEIWEKRVDLELSFTPLSSVGWILGGKVRHEGTGKADRDAPWGQ